MLRGKKTYVVMFLAICAGLYQIYIGDTDGGIRIILEGLGLGALRAGVSKCALN